MIMDSPFYRNQWGSSPRYPSNIRSAIPVTTSNQTTTFPSTHKPKVVSIPVHFIKPEEKSRSKLSRSDYAVRIQKLWRGFRVRKNVKKLLEIQREIDEVGTIILDTKSVETLRRDEKERLKVTERLMNSLFRLDSVGGFDVAVKDLRKSFIRRAIALQEKVDSIEVVDKADNFSPEELNCENEDEESGTLVHSNCIEEPPKVDSSAELNCENRDLVTDWESEPVEKEVVVVKEEKSDSSDMMKRMMEDNKRLVTLMADLYDRSEMQTRILSSLSERLEHLENAFACEKLCRRIKKQKKSRISNSKSIRRTSAD